MHDFDNYEEVTKKVKVLIGKDVDLKLALFEKNHAIIEIIQRSKDVIVVFYI